MVQGTAPAPFIRRSPARGRSSVLTPRSRVDDRGRAGHWGSTAGPSCCRCATPPLSICLKVLEKSRSRRTFGHFMDDSKSRVHQFAVVPFWGAIFVRGFSRVAAHRERSIPTRRPTNQSLRAPCGRAGSVERTRLTGCTLGGVVGWAYGGFYRRGWLLRRWDEPVGRLQGRTGRTVAR